MKKVMFAANSIIIGATLTLFVSVLTLLYLMFSQGDSFARRSGLFDAIYFEASEGENGVVSASMGVSNGIALGIIFIVCTILGALIQLSYAVLKGYRSDLLAHRESIGASQAAEGPAQ